MAQTSDEDEVPCGSEGAIEKVVGDKGRMDSGRALVVGGKLRGVQCFAPRRGDGTFAATVEGSAGASYDVRVTFGGGGEASTECSCKDAEKRGGGRCKHAAGLLLTRLRYLRDWGLVGGLASSPRAGREGGSGRAEEEGEQGLVRGTMIETRDMDGVEVGGPRAVPAFIIASGARERESSRGTNSGGESDKTEPVRVIKRGDDARGKRSAALRNTSPSSPRSEAPRREPRRGRDALQDQEGARVVLPTTGGVIAGGIALSALPDARELPSDRPPELVARRLEVGGRGFEARTPTFDAGHQSFTSIQDVKYAHGFEGGASSSFSVAEASGSIPAETTTFPRLGAAEVASRRVAKETPSATHPDSHGGQISHSLSAADVLRGRDDEEEEEEDEYSLCGMISELTKKARERSEERRAKWSSEAGGQDILATSTERNVRTDAIRLGEGRGKRRREPDAFTFSSRRGVDGMHPDSKASSLLPTMSTGLAAEVRQAPLAADMSTPAPSALRTKNARSLFASLVAKEIAK